MVPKWAQEHAGFASCNFAEGSENDADGDGAGAGSGAGEGEGAGGGGGSGDGGDTRTTDDRGSRHEPPRGSERWNEVYSSHARLKALVKEGFDEKDWRANRDEFKKFRDSKAERDRIRQEHAQYEAGEHPKFKEREVARYEQGFNIANERWVDFLKERGIWEEVEPHLKDYNERSARGKTGRRDDGQRDTRREPDRRREPEREPDDAPKPMTHDDFLCNMREREIKRAIKECVGKSPLRDDPEFARSAEWAVYRALEAEQKKAGGTLTHEQADAIAAKVPEFYAAFEAAEKKRGEAWAKHQIEAEKARRAEASRTTPAGGNRPAGMSLNQALEAEEAALRAKAKARGIY
ncbi:MAG: hypothetical protein WC789_10630 [Lentisphaeria bacterium]